MIGKLFSVALIFVLSVSFAFAQAAKDESPRIAFIDVEGVQRVEADTVRAYMVIRKGMHDDVTLVDQSVKSLFASGLFADVTIRRARNGLIVSVVENPIINRISFEGNKKIRDKKLTDESQLRPRQIYTRAKVQDDVERFIELYRRAGRFAAVINPQVVQLPQNRVDLIYEITEGPKTGIRSLNFQGNLAFSDRRLRNEILTRESRWWRFLTSNDNYDPDRIAYDQELLRRFYLGKGYADFNVVSSSAELSRDGTQFYVTFNVDEGEIYQFAKPEIMTELDALTKSALNSAITHFAGQRYDARKIDSTVDKMTSIIGQRGFAFASIRPRVIPNPQDKTVKVAYVIAEGARVYIERINIRGNTRTQDHVIRRAIRLNEGDAFNRTLLARSERSIRALDFFTEVKVEESPGSHDDQIIINVDVAEKATGELSFGLGYSSIDKLSAEFSIRERNFLGRGQELGLVLKTGRFVDNYSVSFTEPHFLDRNFSAGVQAFNVEYDYNDINGVTSRSRGLSGSLGFPLSDNSSIGLNLVFSEVSYRNNTNNLSLGSNYDRFKTEFGYVISIDHRDDVVKPTSGWRLSVGQSLAGPLGEIDYLRTTGGVDFYHEIAEGWVMHLSGSAGYIFDYNNPSAEYFIGQLVEEGIDYRTDNFYRTGNVPIRGFDRNGIGPRYVTRDDNGGITTSFAVGAKAYLLGTIEVQIPLGIPEDLGIKSVAFIDFGVLGDTDIRKNVQLLCSGAIVFDPAHCNSPTNLLSRYVEDDLAFRASIGISFSWNSPIGPLRFDFAKAFEKEEYDRPKTFRFTVGTAF